MVEDTCGLRKMRQTIINCQWYTRESSLDWQIRIGKLRFRNARTQESDPKDGRDFFTKMPRATYEMHNI